MAFTRDFHGFHSIPWRGRGDRLGPADNYYYCDRRHEASQSDQRGDAATKTQDLASVSLT